MSDKLMKGGEMEFCQQAGKERVVQELVLCSWRVKERGGWEEKSL